MFILNAIASEWTFWMLNFKVKTEGTTEQTPLISTGFFCLFTGLLFNSVTVKEKLRCGKAGGPHDIPAPLWLVYNILKLDTSVKLFFVL